MNEPVAQPAAEPAAPDFAAFEATENAKAVGAPVPEPAPVAEPADPEADEQDAAEPEPAPAPVAEPAPVAKVSKRQAHINELTRKAAEADRRAADLAAKIAAIEARTAPKAEPVAEPAKPATPVADPKDPEPTEADYDDYSAFTRALARWEVRQFRREEEAAAEAKAAQDAERTRVEASVTSFNAWVDRREAFVAQHPARAQALSDFLATLVTGTPIGDAILDSDVGPELADYLASNPTEAERIARLAPISALRALGKLEASLSPTHASARAQPAAKLVTTAPAPPMTLASRTADPADRVAAAVARGDYSTFELEENRKALAAGR
jgi:hypothetical protein